MRKRANRAAGTAKPKAGKPARRSWPTPWPRLAATGGRRKTGLSISSWKPSGASSVNSAPAELTAGIVRQLLRDAEDEGRIRVRVSPCESRFVQDSVRELQGGGGTADSIEVIADPAIPEGACRMETAAGFVETSVAAQLGILQAALEKELLD